MPPLARRALDALAAFDATSRSILVTDATQRDNPIVYANAAFTSLCGYSESEVAGRNCRFLQGKDTDQLAVATIRAAVTSGVSIRREILNYRRDGTPFWNDLTIDPVRDATGRLVSFVSIQSEADKAHVASAATAEAEARLDGIASHIPGYIYRRVMRTDGTIEMLYCSPSLNRMLDVGSTDIRRSIYDHIHPEDREALFTAIRLSAAHMSVFTEEFRLLSVSGVAHWLRSDAPPRRMENGEIVWDGLAIEIGAEKRWQSEIAALALRDPMTGLLTREAWQQALTMQLDGASVEARRCGLLYVDIRAFSDLNQQFGQRLCDDILREVARRLTGIANSVSGAAARLGGDEFALLVPTCTSDAVLSHLASSTSRALAEAMHVGPQALRIQTYIGAALCSGESVAENAERDVASEVMAQAELALRRAKQAERGGFIVYSPDQDDRFRNRAVLAGSLERAIEDDELELHYQPLVDLASGRIVSAEALVRWNHPTLGMQRPDLFIPIAEESGLIAQLGIWVIKQAVRQRSLWRDAGLAPPPIAVNVSGKDLIEPAFVSAVKDTLTNLQATAQDFEIELTEHHLIEASPQIMASLHALRDMGFIIAIDDFGSGHATFRYLRDFPVDKVKIDQIFIRKLVLGSNDALIIRAIISLARGMKIGFVAEGIETEMQRDFLLREGCEIGQGYLFSMPLVAEDFAWLLANDFRLPLTAPAKRGSDGSSIDAGPIPSMETN